MSDFFIQIIPVILLFFVGMLLKVLKVATKSDGDTLLKLAFYLAIPAMTLLSMQRIVLELDFFFLPLAAGIVMVITYLLARLASRFIKMSRGQQGTFIIGCMIMNTGFGLPFFIAAYADQGFIRASLFDLGNIFLIFTFAYYVAIRHGNNSNQKLNIWKKMLIMPPLWAVVIGLGLNLGSVGLPLIINNMLQLISNTTIPLVMIALGIYFKPKIYNLGKVAAVYAIRIVCGLLIGLLIVYIFRLNDLTAKVIIISAATPVGYNTLVLSLVEGLDSEFAASLVSFSLILGIFYIPLLIWILS